MSLVRLRLPLAPFMRVLLAAALLAALPVQAAPPTPFTATYHLAIAGWPDADVTHRLSREGDLWQSDMRTSVRIASGEESSRFRLADGQPVPVSFTSGYSLLGYGKQYRLSQKDMAALPDRQTALFQLSRQASRATCRQAQNTPCEIAYLDHKGRRESLHYRVTALGESVTPAGTYPSVTLDAWDPEEPDRRLSFTFHSEVPGLLLAVEYYRDGQRKSHMTLASLTLAAPVGDTGRGPQQKR
ncbi:hypothetical protein GCM10027040_33460 [Halomonas shantousis]